MACLKMLAGRLGQVLMHRIFTYTMQEKQNMRVAGGLSELEDFSFSATELNQ
jgi:hypothetical protein